jgi:hypothetical protein
MAYINSTHLTPAEKQQFDDILSKKTAKVDTCTIWLGEKY